MSSVVSCDHPFMPYYHFFVSCGHSFLCHVTVLSRHLSRHGCVHTNPPPPITCPLQMELGSTVVATVEYKTAYYVLCSCSTIAGVYPAFGIFDAVSGSTAGGSSSPTP